MKIHIVGMCGRIYAPLAKALADQGHTVTGSDDRPMPPVSDFLAEYGLKCAPNFAAENLPDNADLVLVNAFYGAGNVEVDKARAMRIPIDHFAHFLGKRYLISTRNAVVTGSYGKTTTSSMLAWILLHHGLDPGWLVGGSCENLGEYLRIRETGPWVLEGDEYRCSADDPSPKFRHYNPAVGIVTAIDHVHQDLIGSLDETEALFADFASSVKQALFVADTPGIRRVLAAHVRCGMEAVGFQETADRRIMDYRWEKGASRFSFLGVNFSLPLRGAHSCLNAALAISASEQFGISAVDGAAALRGYRGVKERQEVLIDTPDLTVIHDSGIYPRSIAQVVAGVASSSEGRRVCLLLHPRYTLGDPGIYHSELAQAISGVNLLLIADAVNIPGIKGAFEFDLESLRRHLAGWQTVTPIGPAMKCFDAWKRAVQPGDVWLILTEPLFPEPVASIREHIRQRTMPMEEPVAA